jgi:hypothetical protein
VPLRQGLKGHFSEPQQWLEALRAAAQAEFDQGHRISL